MKRREFVTLFGSALIACATGARAQPRMLRVGFVGIQERDAANYVAFRTRMAELGYQEGRNFAFDYVQSPDIDGYAPGYRELVGRGVDILLTAGNEPALRAALAAAGSLPVVFIAVDYDPLLKGFVQSLAVPGSNTTGILVRQIELSAKRVELLRELLPQARIVGLPYDVASHEQAEAAAAAARILRFEPRLIEVTGQTPDYAAAFRAMDNAAREPVVIPGSPIFLRDRALIAQVLTQRRHPAISAFRENAASGALMSYGIDLVALFRDIAEYVDRIAKGAKAADIPVEESQRFHMSINLKTAAAIGLSVPVTFSARAHEVFE